MLGLTLEVRVGSGDQLSLQGVGVERWREGVGEEERDPPPSPAAVPVAATLGGPSEVAEGEALTLAALPVGAEVALRHRVGVPVVEREAVMDALPVAEGQALAVARRAVRVEVGEVWAVAVTPPPPPCAPGEPDTLAHTVLLLHSVLLTERVKERVGVTLEEGVAVPLRGGEREALALPVPLRVPASMLPLPRPVREGVRVEERLGEGEMEGEGEVLGVAACVAVMEGEAVRVAWEDGEAVAVAAALPLMLGLRLPVEVTLVLLVPPALPLRPMLLLAEEEEDTEKVRVELLVGLEERVAVGDLVARGVTVVVAQLLPAPSTPGDAVGAGGVAVTLALPEAEPLRVPLGEGARPVGVGVSLTDMEAVPGAVGTAEDQEVCVRLEGALMLALPV